MKKFIKRLFWLFMMGTIAMVAVSAIAIAFITHDLPKLDSIEDYRPPQASRVYDAQGHIIAEYAIEKRTLIDVASLPAHVRFAFIAAEDSDFYNHKGIDYIGLIRAIGNEIKYKLVGGKRIGGSTITQQTAKLMLLSSKKTYTRKLKEMVLAHRIEDALNKDEILDLYLNQIYFGNGAYGIEEAARTYYGVPAHKLTLGQATALAAAPKSPNRLNPIADPERVKRRREYVLEQMVIHGFTTQVYAQAASKEPVQVEVDPNPYLDIAPYFTEEIRKQLVEQFGEEAVFYRGLSVYTSLNPNLQKIANKSVRSGLRAVDKRQGYRGPILRPDSETLAQIKELLNQRRAELFSTDGKSVTWDLSMFVEQIRDKGFAAAAKEIKAQKLKKGMLVAGIISSISDKNGTVSVDLGATNGSMPFSNMKWARRFNIDHYTRPPKKPSDVFKKGDIILVRLENEALKPTLSLEQTPLVGGALVALDANDGSVISMVGGYDFRTSKFNRATQAKRQPGSSFKPFVYGTAIDREKVTAATIITDAPKVFFEAHQDGSWKPKNATGRFLGDITVRTCLTRSVNTCSISLLEKTGINAVRQTAADVGLLTDKTPFPRDLTLALGSADVIPIDLVNAYRVFPNHGLYSKYNLFNKVTTARGRVLHENNIQTTQALRPETAYIVTSILRGLMRGISKRTGITDELAGKTGTTNQMRSAWFLGYSQDVVAGVFVGFDDNRSLGPSEYGFKAALPIWGNFMKGTLKEIPARRFEEPDGITWRLIDTKTGLLADLETSYETGMDLDPTSALMKQGITLEAFISGTEPLETQGMSGPPPLEMLESADIAP